MVLTKVAHGVADGVSVVTMHRPGARNALLTGTRRILVQQR